LSADTSSRHDHSWNWYSWDLTYPWSEQVSDSLVNTYKCLARRNSIKLCQGQVTCWALEFVTANCGSASIPSELININSTDYYIHPTDNVRWKEKCCIDIDIWKQTLASFSLRP
jgi:hypothetical protein